MMRLAWLLLLASGLVHGQDRVSLVFDEVPLADLARVVYGEIAREPYIIAPEALAARQPVSLALRAMDRRQAVAQVDQLLTGAGYMPRRQGGVVWIGRTQPVDDGEYVYRPRHRSVSYLVDLLSPLFKPGAFSYQRGLANQSGQLAPVQAPQMSQAGQRNQQQAQSQRAPIADSGTSAYSLMDKIPDVLVFKGGDKEVHRLTKILDQLDTPTPELLVKAVVFEVSTDQQDKSALALALNILDGAVKLGSVAAGDYSAVLKAGRLDVVFNALASDSRFRVVSSPTLRVRSGSQARLTVGSETPVLGNAQIDRNGNPVQSVEYRPAGVILDLKPQVREDVAELAISQQISNFIPTTTGVNSSPTLLKRELATSVGVRADEILVLGGLDQEQASQDKTGLSWLPSWLSGEGRQNKKSEVLLILQAQRL